MCTKRIRFRNQSDEQKTCQVTFSFWSPYKEEIIQQRGAWEMSQLLKHVLYKLKDRSSDSPEATQMSGSHSSLSVIAALEGGDGVSLEQASSETSLSASFGVDCETLP